MQIQFSRHKVFWGLAGLVLLLAIHGAWDLARKVIHQMQNKRQHEKPTARIPISKLPGPPREHGPMKFELTAENSQTMIGVDDQQNERWADVAGNYYSQRFINSFSYSRPTPKGPVVRVRIEPRGKTLAGRLEARGLKPNFAYQIKLRGIFDDRTAFEKIGYAGRWRLPGRETNYSDRDYETHPNPEEVEAYILFDFFVTDAGGNAVRNFALDSSLHVLWSALRQRFPNDLGDLVAVVVDATNPLVYARPKKLETVELLWAEREVGRYKTPDQTVFLPPGRYRAELVLTEESFHSRDNDGGWWATVFVCPIEFEVVSPEQKSRSD
ncbi:MAG: hypothetical protein N2255_05970 [Kiritimatiellae bacterium]|nr:hypothetical protein [Kiritimatiellia bacterium]